MHAHSGASHNSEKTDQMSINTWMVKQIVIYTYDGVLFIQKKEWSTDTYYLSIKLNKYAKWDKLDTKNHILNDSIHMKYPE